MYVWMYGCMMYGCVSVCVRTVGMEPTLGLDSGMDVGVGVVGGVVTATFGRTVEYIGYV